MAVFTCEYLENWQILVKENASQEISSACVRAHIGLRFSSNYFFSSSLIDLLVVLVLNMRLKCYTITAHTHTHTLALSCFDEAVLAPGFSSDAHAYRGRKKKFV